MSKISPARLWTCLSRIILRDHGIGRPFKDIGPINGRMSIGGLNLRVTGWVVVFVIFEAVEVLVAFPASIAAVWLVFFHAHGTGIRVQRFGINDGEGTVFVIF